MSPLTTIVIRHKRENLKKCSLRGLEKRTDFHFFSFPLQMPVALDQHLILALDAPPLTKEDCSFGICLIDATWRYANVMLPQLDPAKKLLYRSLPCNLRTAYPRKQTDCSHPNQGLASIEALYAAYTLLGKDTSGLLDHYYWAQSFLEKNNFFFN